MKYIPIIAAVSCLLAQAAYADDTANKADAANKKPAKVSLSMDELKLRCQKMIMYGKEPMPKEIQEQCRPAFEAEQKNFPTNEEILAQMKADHEKAAQQAETDDSEESQPDAAVDAPKERQPEKATGYKVQNTLKPQG